MVGQYIIVHNRGKWENRKKTENKNTEKNINTEKYWNNRRIKVKFDFFFFQCHFHICCQVVSSSSSDEHQHEEEESGQFTEFQLETLKAHNELRLDLIWKLFWQNVLLIPIKMIFWHQSKWSSEPGQNTGCLRWSSVQRQDSSPRWKHNKLNLSSSSSSQLFAFKMCTYAQEWADQLLAENRFQHRWAPPFFWESYS